eukprot:CAMPEP_0114469584 /NCGR_PEP_ID=MMETSP0104-20121206/10799_1 /TAXON_ID=37642 ORGANISM="Paraphysomonas imperforata, Strain PA2" /NCGR_SAMPLE_ID=MMETSP0104 /ASSEMBLY_ACC=CAM_ASM_000202 /LENGTH=476 /DNA_ID=CAMNT_0001643257 /DNA_START=22 /DNA_END=1452 /DNA_ORIENTATION=+
MEFEEGELVEVDTGDDVVPNDDDESVMNEEDDKDEEDDEEMEEGEEDEFTAAVVDQSAASFSMHGDCVYVSAIHPTKPGVVLTGGGDDRGMLWTYQTTSSSSNDEQGEDNAAEGDRNIVQCIELSGHTDTVTAVGFNFDGSMCLTGGYDGLVKIWKTETGELVQSLEGPEDVEWAQWHSKGNAVVAGSKDGTIWMWLAHNGQCVQVFAGHDGEVTCGLFTKDGKTIVSGGEDGSVRLWAPKTGQCKHVFTSAQGAFEGHESIVTSLAGSDDGEYVVSGGMDGQVRLYLVPKKKLLQKFTHSSPTKSQDKADVPPPPPNLSSDKAGEDFDPSDDIEEEDEMRVQGVECVGVSAKEWKYVASGGSDKTLKIWDITTGTCRCVCQHDDEVVALKWHATLPVVVTACLDRKVRIWDARSGACMQEFTGHRDIITNLDFCQQPVVSNDKGQMSTVQGDVIVSVSDDGTAKVFVVNLQALLA